MSQGPTAGRSRSKARRPEGEVSSTPGSNWLVDWGLLLGSFLGLTFLLGLFPLKDTDFWWHLKAGDLIRQTGQIPRVDTFTFGAEGRRWVDLHWLFQVLLSWGFALGGVVGLNLAKSAITSFALLVLVTSRRREWPLWAMLLSWLPALLVLNGRMYIRPETISLLYLSLVLAILFRWDRQPWLALGLPLVQVCWVNTQGLFLLEPIVIGFAVLDAVARPGSLSPERRRWWRIIGLGVGLSSLACLFNPYGLEGALYPIELYRTMSNPIFSQTIGELKPLTTFIEEVGLDSVPLQLHITAFLLGAASFLLPLIWRGWTEVVDRIGPTETLPELPKGKPRREVSRSRKSDQGRASEEPSWRPSLFRALLFGSFSFLSLAATRNSHQFAAVVGTVTAWNFGEWAAAIQARKARKSPAARAASWWPRGVTFAAIVLVFGAVASGRFYVWSGEGRTVGWGEEPLWFPHDAVKFAGSPGMPDRLVGFHNGYPSLYEYYWAPAKKVYTDARLELMGPDLYKTYLDLGEKLGKPNSGWAEELDRLGRPTVLVDNLDPGNAGKSASLMNSRRWRCVWFDPIVSVFVHDSSQKVVAEHGVDFAARHFQREAELGHSDPPTLAAMSRALRFVGSQSLHQRQAMFLLGLDHARKLREVAPGQLDGHKQAGLIEYLRDYIQTDETIPRYRMPFDPVVDFSTVRAIYHLKQTLAIDPNDGPVEYYLALLYQHRGMKQEAVPLLERYAAQPNKNLEQQKLKVRAFEELTLLRARLGAELPRKWNNLKELEGLVGELLETGRVSAAAEVMDAAYRAEARPWEWADRLAVLWLHLGRPDQARTVWLAADPRGFAATRLARVAATYLVETNFAAARTSYQAAIAADPNSFEAHYGLAQLELDAGFASEATLHANLAQQAATSEHSRTAAQAIARLAEPYATHPQEPLP